MQKTGIFLASFLCLSVTACSQEKVSPQQMTQAKQSIRYFLSGIQSGNPGWSCANSTTAYWVSADWTSSSQVSLRQCSQGFKKRFQNNPLDGADYAQYASMLEELPQASASYQDNRIKFQFNDMPKKACQSSTICLQQEGKTWKVDQFTQGRCLGLKQN